MGILMYIREQRWIVSVSVDNITVYLIILI